MPRDDPRCPECSGPVSSTASYCTHCFADLDESDATVVETAVIDFERPSAAAEGDDADERGAAERRSSSERAWSDLENAIADAVGADRGLFHPDSLVDDVSTGAVGIVTGIVVGFVAMVLVLFATSSAIGFVVGPVVAIGVGRYVGWTRSVFVALRRAAYLLAPALAALPLAWFGEPVSGGSLGGRVFVFVVSELIVLPFVLVLVGVGYWVDGKVPD